MPKFQKHLPKDAHLFFHPASDEEFKRRHPVGYKVLVACGITGLFLPLFLFMLATLFLWPVPESGFLLLGGVGCFIIGIGFFNIAAAWIDQYLGHWLTISAFFGGSLLVAISCTVLYVPDIYSLFDEELTDCYFLTLLLLCLPPIFYFIFRVSLESWLRRKGASRSKIKKLMKGKRNFWWYEEIHSMYDLGLLYLLNKLVTVAYPVALVLALFLGWLRAVIPIICGLHILVALAMAVMNFFSGVQDNMEEYGTPIVLLRRNSQKGIDSVVFHLWMAIFPLASAYAHLKMVLDIVQPT